MKKIEDTSVWATVIRMATEGASLREIAEEVDCTPGAINTALKRNNIEKAPAPPGPRARRGAAPPPPKAAKVPKVGGEPKTRQKAAKAPKAKTFPDVIGGVLEEFGLDTDNLNDPVSVGQALRSVFVSLGLTPKDNLSDDADCDENADSDFTPSVQVDADVNSDDDGGDCDGFDADHVRFAFGLNSQTTVSDDDDNITLTGTEEIGDDDPRVSQTVMVDPNEVTLRGEIIDSPDDWGTPPSFTIPSDDDLDKMNREDLRGLFANPAIREAAIRLNIKGYSKMSPDDLRRNLARVRDES